MTEPHHDAETAPVRLRDLQQILARAADAKIAEVVSLVDSMADRGAADALLAPLRDRLLQLRPQRRLTFTRLLFIPVDPIIVSAPQWRRKSLTIPRTALNCLSVQIRAALGEDAAMFEAELSGRLCDDRNMVLQCGMRLWPKAAEILADGPVPADWAATTGLTDIDHAELSHPLAVLLREGAAIEAMAHLASCGHSALATPLRACISDAIDHTVRCEGAVGGRAIGMLLAVLLVRLPASDQVITIAGDIANASGDAGPRLAADMAIDFMLDGIEAGHARQPELATAAIELSRLSALLDTLERPGPASRPARKARAAQLRRDIDISCRARFEAEIEARLVTQTGLLGPDASDSDVMALEAAALDLRRFEAASRAFGSAAHYDRVLKEATRNFTQSAPKGTQPVDLARLVEIMQGPEAAMALLISAGAAG